ncbi:MAG: hypothetical protein Q9212_000116 [Teloschistes hypoglaucus]
MPLRRQYAAQCIFHYLNCRQALCGIHRQHLAFPASAIYPSRSKSDVAIPHSVQRPATGLSNVVKSTSLNSAAALNPPDSTLPPPLSLPQREPNLSRLDLLKFYYRTGKAYLSFYKSGIKAVWANYKLLRQLRTRIPSDRSAEQALRDGHLTRGEYHLIRRTRSDVSRIPLFGIVLLICGEFTPFVVLFLGLNGAVPKTCHVPKQVDGAREKLEARRRESFRQGTIIGNNSTDVGDITKLPKPILAHVGKSLGLYSSLWDKIGVTPTPFLSWRMRKVVERIHADDFALERDGGIEHLSDEESKRAAEDRGLDVLGKPTSEVRAALDHWLDARKQTSIFHLLSTRPSVWPQPQGENLIDKSNV